MTSPLPPDVPLAASMASGPKKKKEEEAAAKDLKLLVLKGCFCSNFVVILYWHWNHFTKMKAAPGTTKKTLTIVKVCLNLHQLTLCPQVTKTKEFSSYSHWLAFPPLQILPHPPFLHFQSLP
jgi:hypothetical protein